MKAKKRYERPVFRRVKGFDFYPKGKVVCRQCASCHGCR